MKISNVIRFSTPFRVNLFRYKIQKTTKKKKKLTWTEIRFRNFVMDDSASISDCSVRRELDRLDQVIFHNSNSQ